MNDSERERRLANAVRNRISQRCIQQTICGWITVIMACGCGALAIYAAIWGAGRQRSLGVPLVIAMMIVCWLQASVWFRRAASGKAIIASCDRFLHRNKDALSRRDESERAERNL